MRGIMSKDFMSDCGLDDKPELSSAPLFKSGMPDPFGKSAGPFRPGMRVRHRQSDRRGRITFVGYSGGRCIGCEWDGDGSVGMHEAEELSPES